jgi:hypothetical protein
MNVPEPFASVASLSDRAWREFDAVADYIWKIPAFIEREREIEMLKLSAYFAEDDEEARRFRWHHESQKLDGVFPFLIATGNLFSLISLLEVYLLQLCRVLEMATDVSMQAVKGQGFKRLLAYLRRVGVEPSKALFWQQVDAAVKIRHCFTHASGILSYSREDTELRRIVSSCTYLGSEHRVSRQAKKPEKRELYIVASDFGDRLEMNINYSFLLSAYCRDFFVGLCDIAVSTLKDAPGRLNVDDAERLISEGGG